MDSDWSWAWITVSVITWLSKQRSWNVRFLWFYRWTVEIWCLCWSQCMLGAGVSPMVSLSLHNNCVLNDLWRLTGSTWVFYTHNHCLFLFFVLFIPSSFVYLLMEKLCEKKVESTCHHWRFQFRASLGIFRVKFRSIVVITYRNS